MHARETTEQRKALLLRCQYCGQENGIDFDLGNSSKSLIRVSEAMEQAILYGVQSVRQCKK